MKSARGFVELRRLAPISNGPRLVMRTIVGDETIPCNLFSTKCRMFILYRRSQRHDQFAERDE